MIIEPRMINIVINKEKQLKEERNSFIFVKERKKSLVESDKGSWVGQMPLTVLASAEDLEHSNILGAGRLILTVFLKLSFDSLTSCFSTAHFLPLTFLSQVLPLPLLFFLIILCHCCPATDLH